MAHLIFPCFWRLGCLTWTNNPVFGWEDCSSIEIQWLSLVTHPPRWSSSEPGVGILPLCPCPHSCHVAEEGCGWSRSAGLHEEPEVGRNDPFGDTDFDTHQKASNQIAARDINLVLSKKPTSEVLLPEMMYYKNPWFLRRKWFPFCSSVCFLGKRVTTKLNFLSFPPFWRSQWGRSCHIRAVLENHQSLSSLLSRGVGVDLQKCSYLKV